MHFSLQDELLSLQQGEYHVSTELDVSSKNPRDQLKELDDLAKRLSESPESLNDGHDFELLAAYLSRLPHLNSKTGGQAIDALVVGFQQTIDSLKDEMALDSFVAGHHVETLERFAYLCQLTTNAVSDRLIQTASRSKSARGSAKSADYIDSAAFVKAWGPRGIIIWRCVHESLVLRLNKLWNSTPARDTYIGAVTKISYQVLENPLLSKGTDLKQRAFHCIGRCVQYYSHTFTAKTTIIQNLQHYDDLSDTMAELLVACYNDFEAHQLADEVLREIGNRDFNGAQDKNSPKSFGRFLVHLSELCPKVVLKHMGILVRFLDSELPSVRSAIIEVIGNLILYLSGLEATNMQRHQITEYFELLEQRFRDNNFACRSKVLQVCIRLTEGSAKFPKQRPRLIDLIISRFEDKTSYVRKLAIKALTAFLLTHPFALDGGPLVQEELATKLRDVQEQMQAIASLQDVAAMALKRNPEVTVASPSPSPDEGVELDESEDSMELDEGTPAPTPSAEVEEPVLPGISEETLALFTQLQLQQRYYKDALRFVYQLSDAIPTLCQLLGSTHKAEVMESMDFFVAAYHYKIDRAVEGVRKMVHLIWIKDNTAGDEAKGVKTKLIDCYSKIYIPPRGGELSDREVTSQTVRNLIGLTNHATLAELTSLEELLGCMMHDDLITADVIAKLWSVYSYTKDDLPRHQRQGAIIILGMLAKAKRDLVANSVDALLRVGLGRLGRADLVLAKYTCIALQCLGSSGKRDKIPKAGEGADKQRSTRFPRDHPIFTQIRSIILDPIESDEWFPLAEQAVNAIYALSEQPDVVCTEIIREKTREVLQLTTPRTPEPASTPAPDSTDVEGEEGMAVDKEGEEASAVTTPPEAQPVAFSQRSGATTMVRSSYPLCQLLFLAGHVAIKQIVLLEIIEAELKRRRGSDSTATKTPSGGKGGGKAAASEEDELEQVTGTTEDEVADTIQHIRERELLYGPTSLLAVYGHMAAHVCSNPQVYADTVLQTHAALALSKMMCVSSLFCETQLPLLVRILTHSQLPTIRSNIIIALGDLTVCFNNLIGENVGYLYGPLHDSDKAVKKNTLMVLTHLILNGMIKVKGQLGEMAKCLEDPDRRISDLAKLFFTELASKDSYLYNNLPDMISTLSTGANAVSEDAFARIMKFIFEFINKDRQTENIVEKLCQRFRTSSTTTITSSTTSTTAIIPAAFPNTSQVGGDTPSIDRGAESRQWRDIAYCLASVPYRTERTFKKLVDAFPLYSDKLGDDAVHQCMLDIISKLRLQGSQRPETRALIKPLLDEFEAKVKEARIRCAGEPDTTAKPRGGGGSSTAGKKNKAKENGRSGALTPLLAAPPLPADITMAIDSQNPSSLASPTSPSPLFTSANDSGNTNITHATSAAAALTDPQSTPKKKAGKRVPNTPGSVLKAHPSLTPASRSRKVARGSAPGEGTATQSTAKKPRRSRRAQAFSDSSSEDEIEDELMDDDDDDDVGVGVADDMDEDAIEGDSDSDPFTNRGGPSPPKIRQIGGTPLNAEVGSVRRSTRISAVATPLNRNRRNQIVESSEDDGEEEEDDGEEEEEAEEESDDEEMDDISDDDL